MMNKDWAYRRGDIYYSDLNPVCGSEQGVLRPVVVIQNNIGNKHAPTLIVAMVTTKTTKKANLPTHYLIRNNDAFAELSIVLLEQIRTIDKKRIKSYLGKTTEKELLGIDKALVRSLSLAYLIKIHDTR